MKTYTATHKNLLKSTVRIKRLNLFKELKSVSGGYLIWFNLVHILLYYVMLASDIPVLKIISVLVSIKFFLEIISVQFQFQYLHHFSNSFVIDNIRTQGVRFEEGCPPPNGVGVWWGCCQNFFWFFASKWCILRAFGRIIRQFKKFRQGKQIISVSVFKFIFITVSVSFYAIISICI